MSKQDRQIVRTAPELERKLGGGRSPSGSSHLERQVQQMNQTLQQFIVNSNAKFEEIENNGKAEVTDVVEKENMSAVTSNAVALALAKLLFRIELLENGTTTGNSAILGSAKLGTMILGKGA